jgi:hypothetical protein
LEAGKATEWQGYQRFQLRPAAKKLVPILKGVLGKFIQDAVFFVGVVEDNPDHKFATSEWSSTR